VGAFLFAYSCIFIQKFCILFILLKILQSKVDTPVFLRFWLSSGMVQKLPYYMRFSALYVRFFPGIQAIFTLFFRTYVCVCPCRIFVLKSKMRIIYRAIFLKIFTNNYHKSVSKINTRLPTYTPMGYLQPFYALFRTKIIPHPTIKTSGKFKQKVIFNLHPHHTQTGDKIATFQAFTSS